MGVGVSVGVGVGVGVGVLVGVGVGVGVLVGVGVGVLVGVGVGVGGIMSSHARLMIARSRIGKRMRRRLDLNIAVSFLFWVILRRTARSNGPIIQSVGNRGKDGLGVCFSMEC